MAELLEDLQRRADRLGREAFLLRHPGPFLVRLDERGGRDEPMPWAFKNNPGGQGPSGTLGTKGMLTPVAGFMARVFELIKVSGHGPRDVVTLGRNHEQDVVIEEKSISKVHASFKLAAGSCEITDVQSRNGIKINGVKVVKGQTAVVKSFDVIHLGDITLLFLTNEDLFDQLPALVG